MAETREQPHPGKMWRWKQDERIVLKPRNDAIKLNPGKREAVFNRVFAAESGRKSDRSALKAAWDERTRSARVNDPWREILEGPMSEDEMAKWKEREERVVKAIQQVEGAGLAAVHEEEEEATVPLDIGGHDPGEYHDYQEPAVEPLDLATFTETPLEMVHSSQVEWAGAQPYWTEREVHAHTIVPHSSQTYRLGAKVYRIIDMEGNASDLTMCMSQFCDICNNQFSRRQHTTVPQTATIHPHYRRQQRPRRWEIVLRSPSDSHV